MLALPGLLSRYETALGARCPHYAVGLAPPASDAALEALEARLGRPLTADLRAMLAWHDGETSSIESVWSLPLVLSPLPSTEVGAVAEEMRELWADQHDEWAASGATYWEPAWTPVLGRQEAGMLCLDAKGQLIEWFHGEGLIGVVAPSLRAWLGAVTELLEAGHVRERPSVVEGDGFVIDAFDPTEVDWTRRQGSFEKRFREAIRTGVAA